MPISLHQLPDEIEALKFLLADQAISLDQIVARNKQLRAGKLASCKEANV